MHEATIQAFLILIGLAVFLAAVSIGHWKMERLLYTSRKQKHLGDAIADSPIETDPSSLGRLQSDVSRHGLGEKASFKDASTKLDESEKGPSDFNVGL